MADMEMERTAGACGAETADSNMLNVNKYINELEELMLQVYWNIHVSQLKYQTVETQEIWRMAKRIRDERIRTDSKYYAGSAGENDHNTA